MNMRLCTCAIANILKKLYAIIFIEISLVRNKVNSKRNTKWHFPIDSTIETQCFHSSQFDTRYCSTCNINNIQKDKIASKKLSSSEIHYLMM